MNIKFQRAGDNVDILFSDDDGPVAQYTIPLHALISALPEDLLDEFWRPQLDDALAQVDNLRAGLAETSRDADRIAGQRDEAQAEAARLQHVVDKRDEVRRQLAVARDLNVTLTAERDEALDKWDQTSRMAADLAHERDDMRQRMAIMENAIAEYDNQRRSIRALRHTIKELTS